MKNDSTNCNLFVEATRQKIMGPVLNLALLLFAIESYLMQIIETISTFLIINLCSYTSQMGFQVALMVKNLPANAGDARNPFDWYNYIS